MNFDMQSVTAKLYQGDAVTHSGTAWLCSRRFALTAAHCIEHKDTPVPRTQLFMLRFRWGVLECVVTWLDHDLDAALLQITGGPINSIPDTIDGFSVEDLPTPLKDNPKWLAYGFPLAKQDGMFVNGAIDSGRAPLGRHEAIQLTCEQGGFEPIKGFNPERQTEGEVLTLAGLSGAAVTYGSAVVGMISWGPAMLGGKVIYAIPVKLIARECELLQQILHVVNISLPPPFPQYEKGQELTAPVLGSNPIHSRQISSALCR